MSSQDSEITFPAFPDHALPIVSYGLPFAEACRKHAESTFKAERIFIICSGSLAKNTEVDALGGLKHALEGKVVGTRIGMTPHTLFIECFEILNDCKALNVDLIITLGGGSLIDAAKLVSLVNTSSILSQSVSNELKALANNIATRDDFVTLPYMNDGRRAASGFQTNARPATIPIISVPTTLSGGEFTPVAGTTDETTNIKYQFISSQGPALIIFDPALAIHTPASVWLSSGVRAVDHCVETLCSLQGTAFSDACSAKALPSLVLGLLRSKRLKSDVEARLLCQLALPNAVTIYITGVIPGASHGIGHMLGPLGVKHGETSCILLPAVCKYNAKYNSASIKRQQTVLDILWGNEELRATFEKWGLKRGDADLGDTIDVIVRELGMPRSLKEVNIGREKFDELAQNSLHDPCLPYNPVPLTEKKQVMEILEMVA